MWQRRWWTGSTDACSEETQALAEPNDATDENVAALPTIDNCPDLPAGLFVAE
ncbi:MAG TPA: hypothetical protein VMY16_13350 [Ilumatobacteraceae bacterium]|nr:hypothetical protein [Ilumatobacteraceae bacterium]